MYNKTHSTYKLVATYFDHFEGVTDLSRDLDELFSSRLRIFRIPSLQNGRLVVGDHRPDPRGTGRVRFRNRFFSVDVVVVVVFRLGKAVFDRPESEKQKDKASF